MALWDTKFDWFILRRCWLCLYLNLALRSVSQWAWPVSTVKAEGKVKISAPWRLRVELSSGNLQRTFLWKVSHTNFWWHFALIQLSVAIQPQIVAYTQAYFSNRCIHSLSTLIPWLYVIRLVQPNNKDIWHHHYFQVILKNRYTWCLSQVYEHQRDDICHMLLKYFHPSKRQLYINVGKA